MMGQLSQKISKLIGFEKPAWRSAVDATHDHIEFIQNPSEWAAFVANAPAFDHGLLPSWERGWNSPPETLGLLNNAISRIKPKVIFETGTLVAHATMAMAAACQSTGTRAKIFTFDYDGDPVTDKNGDIELSEWKKLADIRLKNLNTIREACPIVDIEFVDGDSRKTLPLALEKTGSWDFWFQDSMHYKSGILEEYALMQTGQKPGSVIVFDNVDHRHPFGRHFISKFPSENWAYQSYTHERNRQLWCHYLPQNK